MMQVNGRRSEAFSIERSVQQCCPLSPLLYVLTLEPLLRRVRHGEASPALCDIPFAGPLSAKVSMYADDITVFVSHSLYIKAVEAAAMYKQIAGAKINFDKREGLWLGAWRCGVVLLE